MVEEKIPPNDGLDILYQIYLHTNYDSNYECWYLLDDDRVNLGSGIAPISFINREIANFDKKIIIEALKFLNTQVN